MVNSSDQYLKTIYLLQAEENDAVGTGAIADRLGVSPASANEMIGKLAERKLVDHEKYKGVELTDAGILRARERVKTYCIIERFLANVLDVEEFQREAKELETVIDDTVADRLDTIIEREDACPDCFDVDTDACIFLETLPASEGSPTDA